MTARICWNCGVYAQMHGMQLASPRKDPWQNWAIPMQCGHCGDINVAHVSSVYEQSTHVYTQFMEEDGSIASWHPRRLDAPDFPDTPREIAEPAHEAYVASSNYALRAAILMARGVLEAICKDHGVTNGQLFQKIDAMESNGHITKSLKNAAHAVRDLGNDMAHGDFVKTDPTEAQAKQVLAIMRLFIEQLYEQPAQTRRLLGEEEANSES